MWRSAVELVEKLRGGEVKAVEVIDYCFERIRDLNPKINAFITLNDRAVEEAKNVKGKPLAGLPIAVKDNVETKGLKTTYGSKLFENHVSKSDSIIVERLRRAGAVIIGKTNMPEFGLIAYTDNLIIGPSRNPYDLSKTVGGSSGGSAAAVAADMVPAATGNDAGGSIRIPASFCNLFGLKPTFGRVPVYPRVPVFSGLICEGFLTSCVEDSALLLDLVKGYDVRDPTSLPPDSSYLKAIEEQPREVKFAFSVDLGYAIVDPSVERVVRDAVRRLEKVGVVEEVEVKLPNLEYELTKKVASELLVFLGDRLEEWKRVAYPPHLKLLDLARSISLSDYIAIEHAKLNLWKATSRIFKKYDILVTPTVAVPPFDIGRIRVYEIAGKPVSPLGWMPFTYPFNFTGQPAASIPAGFIGNLPVGMQLIGRHHSEAELLKVCKVYQEIYNWRRKPEIK